MQISANGINLIKRFDGCELAAYPDVVGVWTLGYGWTQSVDGKPIRRGMTIDRATAERLLKTGVVQYERAVNQLVRVSITQNQFDALVSFTYIRQSLSADECAHCYVPAAAVNSLLKQADRIRSGSSGADPR
ncbi:lysozyme [Pectobacterium versatile]|uniref:lysozyme n=1 Tax=Pectobacterium versatile TaxID=2488639 RepID=UPI001CCDFA34|nr:lysozyme [Pectobacterium versatile]